MQGENSNMHKPFTGKSVGNVEEKDSQTFIKPADMQINLEAKSKPGGQNGLIYKNV
jgi:hypothetical protein